MDNKEIIIRDDNQVAQVNETAVMQIATEYVKDIQVPANYDANNAVKNFCLEVSTLKDKKGNRALDVCTPQSIVASMQKMISLGLNPTKKQGYLIVRGNTLCLDNGAFGNVKIMKDVTGYEMFSEVIYDGDKVKITRRKDGSQVIEVQTTWANIRGGKIVGAYAVVSDRKTGTVINSDIMTMEDIRISWAQSSTKDLSTHKKFPHEMARKTVESRLAKRLVNTSDDTRKYADLEKYIINEDSYNVIDADEELGNAVNLENDAEAEVVTADDNSITALELDDIGGEEQDLNGAVEILYREYKASQDRGEDKYEVIPNTYNAKKHTCLVRVKGE
jgi:recombination protein RecT